MKSKEWLLQFCLLREERFHTQSTKTYICFKKYYIKAELYMYAYIYNIFSLYIYIYIYALYTYVHGCTDVSVYVYVYIA